MKKLYFLAILIATFPYNSFSCDNFNHGISTFGGLKYPKNFKKFDYASKKARKGGKIKLGAQGSFNSFNPFILKGLPASGIEYLYDSLMVASDDEISTYYGLIAKCALVSRDKKSVSFWLNKKARFADGEKVTADDVIFTFETLIEKAHPSYKIAYKDVKKVIKINDYLVKFIFKNNKNKDLPILLASMKILPKHFYENREFDSTSLEAPLGSGAYLIEDFSAAKSITYKRNKNYWARDLAVNFGRYNFDEIQYDYYLDPNVMIEAFKAGEFDLHQENIARNWANSYDEKNLKKLQIIKQEIAHKLPAPIQAFVFNLRREKFQNRDLRKAMTYAFNFEWLKKHIFYGSYKRTKSYFANSDFGYKNFELPISDENNFGRGNLLIARKILQNAGYKIIDGKLHDKKNQIIEVEFLIASKAFQMIIAPFIDNLKKLGIAAKMKFVEQNQYESRLRNFDYDIVVSVFGQNLIPSSELIRYWHSSQKNVKGSQNYSGLDDEKVDFLVEKIALTKNKKSLQKLTYGLDKYMVENYFVIPQWHNNSYRILRKSFLKRPKKAPKYSLGFDFWWIEN